MRILLAFLFLLTSCNAVKSEYHPYIKDINLSIYNGKTVSNIQYCDGCGNSGDLLIITFTDNTTLKVYAYKYDMKSY